MRNSLIDFAAAAAIAAGLTAMPAVAQAQQIQRQDTVVTTGTIVRGAPSPFAAATVRTYTYEPVCIVHRVPFSDEYGWRVRDVRVCYY
jgi:hypothetical protein